MNVYLLTEHHLEFLSLKGGCRGSSESTLAKMSNCWKSHAAAQVSWLRTQYDAFYSYRIGSVGRELDWGVNGCYCRASQE